MKNFKIIVCFLLMAVVGVCFAGCMEDGTNGRDGKSAYEIAVDNGFEGSEEEWLASLNGTNGISPKVEIDEYGYWVINGAPTNVKAVGTDGIDGESGKSAYEIAVENGFKGSKEEWLESLEGADGVDGKDGQDGKDGINGTNGKDGLTPTISINSNGYWVINGKVTNVKAVGTDGTNGANGKSAYQIAVDNGFKGTEQEWLTSLSNNSNPSVEISSFNKAVNKGMLSTVAIIAGFGAETASAGTGVIIQDDKESGTAYILTNYHVIYDTKGTNGLSSDIRCYLYGQYQISNYRMNATFVGGSMTYDIAVIKITNSDIYKNSFAEVATVKNSEEVNIGDKVVVLGNAKGQGHAATTGIVSVPSLEANVTQPDNKDYINRLMRVDAAINGGNSGGGLFDIDGNLIGIVKAKIMEVGIEGMGYVIPSNVAVAIGKNIIRNCNGDSVVNPIIIDLGIDVGFFNSSLGYDEGGNIRIIETVAVKEVETSSQFYGKMQANDVVKSISINGVENKIERTYQVNELFLNAKVGDTVIFKVERASELKQYTVTISNTISIA